MFAMTAFAALADPSRRTILELLRARERSVGELVGALPLSQPGVSKHLKVLREAGLVAVRRDGKRRWYGLRAEPLAEVADWLALSRQPREERFEAPARHLQ